MANSAAVNAGDTATASQYNNLRLDVLDVSTGHVHDGVNSALIQLANNKPINGLDSGAVVRSLLKLDASNVLQVGATGMTVNVPVAFATATNVTVGGTLAVTGNANVSGAATVGGTLGVTGLLTATGGLTSGGTVTVGAHTLDLTGSTVSGAPTWSASQPITLSTAAQPNVTSLGTLTSLQVAAGSAAAPTVVGTGATTSGLYWGTNLVGLAANGAVALATDANANTVIGGGVAAPAAWLTTKGVQIGSTVGLASIGSDPYYFWNLYYNGSNFKQLVTGYGAVLNLNHSTGDLQIYSTGGSVAADGNATITNNWTFKQNGQLVGPDGSASAPSHSFKNAATTGMYYDGSNGIYFATNGTQRLQLDSSGNHVLAGTAGATTRTPKSTTVTPNGSGGAYVNLITLPANTAGVLYITSTDSTNSAVTLYVVGFAVDAVSVAVSTIATLPGAGGAFNSSLTFSTTGASTVQVRGAFATAPAKVSVRADYHAYTYAGA